MKPPALDEIVAAAWWVGFCKANEASQRAFADTNEYCIPYWQMEKRNLEGAEKELKRLKEEYEAAHSG